MLNRITKTTIGLVFAFAFTAIYPAVSLADTPPPVVCPAVSGTTEPTGSSSGTFTYNAQTCLWENAYYTWNPVTKIYTPKFSTDFVYNPADGQYEYTNWVYVSSQNKYVPVVVVKPAPPAPQITPQTASGSASPAALPANNSISGSGPNSDNSINNQTQNNALLNLNYDASLNNLLGQNADSGNVSLNANTLAGNATSGNATDVTNLMNLLQSTYGLEPGGNVLTFTTNINGDVTGDLLLDPSQINTTGAGSSNAINSDTANNLTINAQGSGLINNNINLNATSGNVDVTRNTKAGNATSGNANAVANIVNVLNSAIAAGKSFIGVVNINGNLNGDILLPPNFVDQLIASGAPYSTINLSQQQVNNLVANVNNTQTINNNVGLNAASGNVNSSQNTSSGNATSGNADTNLTVFNLTNSQVIGTNSLMVFVNVLGKWVGLIMDAPQGSNTAALCGGSCTISKTTENNTNINANTNNTINNNLNINSQSGNVNSTQNTDVGNATSGNATASANIMNFINSKLSLNDWFGMLFINVFGTWNGSFGVNTSAGDVAKQLDAAFSGGLGGGAPATAKVFQFVPKAGGGFNLTAVSGNSGQSSGSDNAAAKGMFIGGSTDGKAQPPTTARGGSNMLLPIVGAATFMALISAGGLAEYGGKFRDHMVTRRLNQTGQRKAWLRFTIF